MELLESEFVTHIPCEVCGSRDNAAVYTDGHTYCFGCASYGQDAESVEAKPATLNTQLISGAYKHLSKRKITEATCRKFGYQIGVQNGDTVQLATYRNDRGQPVAQKVRTKDKKFSIVGDAKAMTLFGSHLWSNGKKIVVTEGEIDAMSVSQVQNNKWPTVSVPNGAQSAKKAIIKNYDYLTKFDEIILMFDDDKAGRNAALECAEVLPVGRVKLASCAPYKDANDALLAGDAQSVIQAIFQARDYRPDGIVTAVDVRSSIGVSEAVSEIIYPYTRLNEITKGLRSGSLVTVAAGSGVGKSTFIRELAYRCHMDGHKIGMMMLEETVKRTAEGLVGIHLNKNITVDPENTSRDEILASFDDLTKDNQFYLFDHFGSTDMETIVSRIRYMNKGLGCQVIFLDHISILVSGLTGSVSDERRLVDDIMTKLRTLVQELEICLVLVSHLRRPQGEAGHEGGAKVSLSQLRGSHAIAQLADTCIGIQVDPEDPTSGKRYLSILKNRHTGEVGAAGVLKYDRKAGRLIEVDEDFSDLEF